MVIGLYREWEVGAVMAETLGMVALVWLGVWFLGLQRWGRTQALIAR